MLKERHAAHFAAPYGCVGDGVLTELPNLEGPNELAHPEKYVRASKASDE